MNTAELRLGNWIIGDTQDRSGQYIEVVALYYKGVNPKSSNNRAVEYLRNPSPIPITIPFLENIGMELDRSGLYVFPSEYFADGGGDIHTFIKFAVQPLAHGFHIWSSVKKRFKVASMIHYVHQLQNHYFMQMEEEVVIDAEYFDKFFTDKRPPLVLKVKLISNADPI